eukprot:6646777-Pyramimonas_sp.AAC.1
MGQLGERPNPPARGSRVAVNRGPRPFTQRVPHHYVSAPVPQKFGGGYDQTTLARIQVSFVLRRSARPRPPEVHGIRLVGGALHRGEWTTTLVPLAFALAPQENNEAAGALVDSAIESMRHVGIDLVEQTSAVHLDGGAALVSVFQNRFPTGNNGARNWQQRDSQLATTGRATGNNGTGNWQQRGSHLDN